jgi:hypothetical protein
MAMLTALRAVPGWAASAGDSYADFNAYAKETFGLKHEPRTTAIPGDKLALLADGAWQHVSEDSACVAFETNLPAVSTIEYGPTPELGKTTTPTDRAYYIHVHHLRDLPTDKPVHYRLVATDDRGNTIKSEIQTLTPKKIAKAIYLPNEKQAEPPFILDQAGATYVLAKDIVAPGVGVSVVAPNVTLDLNGHTLTYNNEPDKEDPAAQKEFGAMAPKGSQGVRFGYSARGSGKVLNGFIRQGAGNGGEGRVPILARCDEIAGVTIDYQGTQISGIVNECKDVHHNVITDRGAELTNRHQGVQAIGVSGNVHHNLIPRVRQRGVVAQGGAKIYRNEIYVDSCATNSFGIMFYKSRKCEATDNKVFGTGYLAIGIGTVSDGVGEIKINRNFIQMQSHAPDSRWTEYGEQSGAYCVRVTWGGENIEYADNVMVSRGRDGGMVRGIWFCPGPKITNVAFRRNTIKVLAENEKTDKWGAIVISGEDTPDCKPGIFEDNTVISNFCQVRLGEEYGTGMNARFVRNTFVRDGDRPDYATVICGFWTKDSVGSVFLDTRLENGASFDKVRWEGTGKNEFSVGTIKEGADAIEKTYSGKGKEMPEPATAPVAPAAQK